MNFNMIKQTITNLLIVFVFANVLQAQEEKIVQDPKVDSLVRLTSKSTAN